MEIVVKIMNLKNKIIETYKKIGTKAGTARELGLPRTSVRRVIDAYYNKLNTYIEKADTQNKKQKDKVVETENNLTAYTSDKYETEDELFEKYNLDKRFWAIQSISHNEWTTPFKNSDDEVVPFVNEQTKIVFKKMIPDITLDIIKEQYKMMGEKNKYTPIVRKNDSKKKPVMYEIAIFDIHLGKLAYAAETGESYDLKIAEELFMNAIYDLLAKASHLNIEKILFPIGNDLAHYDGILQETTKGTRQDSDTRFTKLYTTISRILVNAIDMLRKCADVDVVVVPSNHDFATIFYIGEYLSAWYRNDVNVNINNSPKTRKYYRYGKTLLGFTHGDKEKQDKLPLLMAREAQEDWSKADFMQWQVGHLHKKREFKYTSGDTFNGVEVKVIPSLSSADAWHYQQGFVKGNRMAVGLVFDKEEGFNIEILSKYIKDKNNF